MTKKTEPVTLDQAIGDADRAAETVVRREQEATDAAHAADELANAISTGETTLGPRDLAAAREKATHAPLLVEAARRAHTAATETVRRMRLVALAREAAGLTPPDVLALVAAVQAANNALEDSVNAWNARIGDLTGRARALGAPELRQVEDGDAADTGIAFEGGDRGLVVNRQLLQQANIAEPRRELVRDAIAVRPQSREDMLREIEENYRRQEEEREARRMANRDALSHQPVAAPAVNEAHAAKAERERTAAWLAGDDVSPPARVAAG
jgi:hypothetical protein